LNLKKVTFAALKNLHMYSNVKIFIVCLAFFLAIACNPKNQDSIKQLDQEILAIHDEVMPKIGQVLDLRKKINVQLDSCNNQAGKDTLQKISYALTKADADMMHWMHHYQMPQGTDTAMVYLQKEQKNIEAVKEQINSSILAAESYLGK
jgi:Holliday junction resolvasome RuvABC ATP-dependent DNA helicase subunit